MIITRNGRDRLIVMSLAMYRELTNPTNPAKPQSHKQAGNGLKQSPKALTSASRLKCDRVR